MLRAILRTTTSSKIRTTTAATSPLYRCRTFCTAVENNNNKSKSELKSAVNTAILDAEQLVKDHQRAIKDLTLKATNLKLAMESSSTNDDVQQILTELQDLKHLLGVASVSPSRKECTFPTEVTALLLQRFGGKPSVWMGRYLRVYQMKMLKYQVTPKDVSDRSANHTLARAIVVTLVLTLFFYL
ncbi:hypothetical protein HA466_0215960 [Hirschfeldia incana]|nr:hypothetical protein HA466_0215960 [Hirschfeldia incana]